MLELFMVISGLLGLAGGFFIAYAWYDVLDNEWDG